ncbi:uncharacterized protein LOC130291910 [Hyla sarda]|uniref:uncharacterized protein LOC130291910 n=1 Tax=Hyla sarda TaxID=327740 RepID=UPI0024C37A0C|nr:uncharacterized protein LOC130291910 [Hyla sarda]
MSRFEWIQQFVTFVFNVLKNIMSVWDSTERQHHQICLEEEVNKVESDGATWNRGEGEDTVDSGGLKDSLEKVSKAIYKKFVFDWHTPPEELQNQPLYKEINSEIQNVFFNIKHKAHPLEEYKIIISIASGFIAHFKNKREKKVTYRFKTRQEEVDFIRKHITCLLDYWLPESMQRNRLIYVFITEILSVNVLEQMIKIFSEFTSINEAIVQALDDNPATEQKEDSGKCDEIASVNTSDESYTIMESDITSRKIQKKEKKGFRKKFKGLKWLRKKGPKTEAAPQFRSYCADMDKDVGDIVDAEEHLSEQSNTDDESTGDSSSSEIESDYSGIEFRTFNTHKEEEKCNNVTDKKSSSTDLQDTDESKRDDFLLDSCDKDKDCYRTDGIKFLRSKKRKEKYQSASPSEIEELPSTDVTGHEEFPSENADRRTIFSNIQHQPPIIMDSHPQKLSQKVIGLTSQNISQTMEQQKKKLQETLLDVVYQLIDEVLAGGNTGVCFLHRNGLLKNMSKSILDSIPKLYAEEQVIWYLEQVAELLMPQVRPQQLAPEILQSKALDILKNKVRGFLPYILILFLESKIMKNLKASHQALQDPLANKATIYGILDDLTKIITDEGGMFNPLTVQ